MIRQTQRSRLLGGFTDMHQLGMRIPLAVEVLPAQARSVVQFDGGRYQLTKSSTIGKTEALLAMVEVVQVPENATSRLPPLMTPLRRRRR